MKFSAIAMGLGLAGCVSFSDEIIGQSQHRLSTPITAWNNYSAGAHIVLDHRALGVCERGYTKIGESVESDPQQKLIYVIRCN